FDITVGEKGPGPRGQRLLTSSDRKTLKGSCKQAAQEQPTGTPTTGSENDAYDTAEERTTLDATMTRKSKSETSKSQRMSDTPTTHVATYSQMQMVSKTSGEKLNQMGLKPKALGDDQVQPDKYQRTEVKSPEKIERWERDLHDGLDRSTNDFAAASRRSNQTRNGPNSALTATSYSLGQEREGPKAQAPMLADIKRQEDFKGIL
uniref:Uncharacterized protein n=1 Tax=Romanomermis culicivorax TaxID=13658 RepID=A0A915JI92_ROMCU